MASFPTLHTLKINYIHLTINRFSTFVHLTLILFLFYYRTTTLFRSRNVPALAWTLMILAELIFTFVWGVSQAFKWRQVSRTVSIDGMPPETELPSIDVFACFANPQKEPVIDVMNNVISALGLDYPAEKLAVYLSDDGGAYVTLHAIKEAAKFAKAWIPFCKSYGIKTRCPEAYFSSLDDAERLVGNSVFLAEEEELKSMYEMFKRNVEKVGKHEENSCVVTDRPPRVEIILDNRKDYKNIEDHAKIPLLVYVSRERRPSHANNFKAGALNALLRVSGILSNAPYMLVLDSDMYCNDPTSAKQAMCFHLDPKISHSLGFVQYPQMFYNVSKNDIYDGQSRSAYKSKWQGMDGLQGPPLTGTGFYMKKKALYGSLKDGDNYLIEPEKKFGSSQKFLNSLKSNDKPKQDESLDALLHEARRLASCTYETNTKWGDGMGFFYDNILESSLTGYLLHTRRWKSVYLYPERPCFLGATTIDMKDGLAQLMKWSSGLFQIACSKYSPLVYGISRMPILQSMCYAYFQFQPLKALSYLIYGTVPQLCLLSGIPVFPKVSSPWFTVFATVYMSYQCQHLYEVIHSGGTIKHWWNEQRINIIKAFCGGLFGMLDFILKKLGLQKVNFRLTNKAVDKEKLEKYAKGKFDFEGASMFMIPLVILSMLNMVCFFGGLGRMISQRSLEELLAQASLSFYILVLSCPILEGVVKGKGKGRPSPL